MTLILAGTGPDGTFIGADSRTSTDYSFSDTTKKLVPVQDFVLGVSGSSRISQLVRYNADEFEPIADDSDMFKFATRFKQLLAEDFKIRTNGTDGEKWTMLLATQAGVFALYKSFQFHSYEHWGIGSGDDFGIGAYRGLGDFGDTGARVRKAIEMTADYVPSVGGPVTVVKVG